MATYISSLRGDEEQALVKEVVPLIEAEKIAEAIKVLVKESKTLLEAPEKGNAMQMTHMAKRDLLRSDFADSFFLIFIWCCRI